MEGTDVEIKTILDQLAPLCRVASPHDSVLNSECAFTFHSPYTSHKGIVVNLQTFVGTVDEYAFQQSLEEGDSKPRAQVETGIFVRIVKQNIPIKSNAASDNDAELSPATQFITKLGIGIEGGFQTEKMVDTISTYSIVLLRKLNDGSVHSVAEFPHQPHESFSNQNIPDIVRKSADSVIFHAGAAVQQDLTAWELDQEPRPVSKYAQHLPFVDNGVVISPNPKDWKCQKTGDTNNLWLNLSDGFIGGGRKNWDGTGGSNGALDHYLDTGAQYPLVVKLGTITQDVHSADCYSYAKDEDCPVTIPNLAELLKARGIHVDDMQKTVKTTAELEVELNATYAFDEITESGSVLIPVSGPGLQGLQNLGNSCYMNSVVQLLFSGCIPELVARYGREQLQPHGLLKGEELTSFNDSLLDIPPTLASFDVLCQTAKLCRVLTSGEFASPTVSSETSSLHPKYRIAPRMFKHVIGCDHADFRTAQQQDAAQYLLYLFEKLDRAELGSKGRIKNENGTFPTKSSSLFAFQTTSRRLCTIDNRVKYVKSAEDFLFSLRIPMESAVVLEPEEKRQRSDQNTPADTSVTNKIPPTVTFQACIDAWAASHTIDSVRWEHFGNNVVAPAIETLSFSNFPKYLIVRFQRYELGSDWTPRKLEVNIDIPELIDLNCLRYTGPQEGELIIPDIMDNHLPTTSNHKMIDDIVLTQLQDMGFGENGCRRALKVVGGSDIEAAMNWIFEHSSDPDFNEPISEEVDSQIPSSPSVDENVVTSLAQALGCFTTDQVRIALDECAAMPDRAADWLFSHMDDLDGAVASVLSRRKTNANHTVSSQPSNATVLDDGDGKYRLIAMISHIGKNTNSGHYVAHVKRNGRWVIINDEKIALSESPPFPHAYLYLFQRLE